VPVPSSSSSSSVVKMNLKPESGSETSTGELSPEEMAVINRWAERHLPASPPSSSQGAGAGGEPAASVAVAATVPVPVSAVRREAGLRICPRCGRPLHLSAVACRECGAPAPRR
jgi:hypothetical protein